MLIITVFLMAISAARAEDKPQLTLEQLLEQVRKGQFQESQANKKREANFLREKRKQTKLLATAKVGLKRLEARAQKLENRFNENELQLGELNELLSQKLGNFAEMFGVIRQVSGEIRSQINASLISGEHKDRAEPLKKFSSTKRLPTIKQLEELWAVLLDEMVAQGQITTFTGNLVGRDGRTRQTEITRIGPFVAIHDGEYLDYLPATQQYARLGRQPGGKFLNAASEIEARTAGKTVTAAIDPARGGILSLLIETPSLAERIDQGGLVGYVIILIAFVGLGLGAWRFFALNRILSAVMQQVKKPNHISDDNPLGRILQAERSINPRGGKIDSEMIELKLHDAILREMPAIELYLPLVRILAAIAPLLGLLGTVTGMILTFQAITLFGTGDPKLMAGGISQALVTTVLGLITAIPLLLLHALASSRARDVRQILEEQAAGLVAARAEGK